jgi:hypothetical protein
VQIEGSKFRILSVNIESVPIRVPQSLENKKKVKFFEDFNVPKLDNVAKELAYNPAFFSDYWRKAANCETNRDCATLESFGALIYSDFVCDQNTNLDAMGRLLSPIMFTHPKLCNAREYALISTAITALIKGLICRIQGMNVHELRLAFLVLA